MRRGGAAIKAGLLCIGDCDDTSPRARADKPEGRGIVILLPRYVPSFLGKASFAVTDGSGVKSFS